VKLDLRILNEATPRFLFNVLKEGILLYCKNIHSEYEIRVISKYVDIKPMLDYFDRLSIEEVLGPDDK